MPIYRPRRARSPRAPGDRGASSLEYGALIVVAALAVGLLGSLVSPAVEGHMRSALCGLFGSECADVNGDENRGGEADGGDDGGEEDGAEEDSGEENGNPADGGGPHHPQYPPVEPSPSPGPPVPQPEPSQEQVETEQVLNETQLGQDALEWVEENGVRVVYRAGGGSYYRRSDNVFYIDTDQTPEERAHSFVHETNHARHRHEPDIDELGRDEYIERAVQEEVESTILEIQNNRQLEESRGVDLPDTTLQSAYETAYDEAIANANRARSRSGLPALDAESAREVGERAGYERLVDAYEDGSVVGSNSGESYVDHYGSAWDDAHDCALWVFC
ncbi:hypothetical protein ACN3XK_13230 [Actinomadura welshii]